MVDILWTEYRLLFVCDGGPFIDGPINYHGPDTTLNFVTIILPIHHSFISDSHQPY